MSPGWTPPPQCSENGAAAPITSAKSSKPALIAADLPPNSETAPAPPVAPPSKNPGVMPRISATSSGQNGCGYAVGIVTPSPWPWKSFSLSPASSNARCIAQERYWALDFRGSPGLDPRRSVGVSQMPTIAALFVMLILDPCSFALDHRPPSAAFQGKFLGLTCVGAADTTAVKHGTNKTHMTRTRLTLFCLVLLMTLFAGMARAQKLVIAWTSVSAFNSPFWV